MSDTDLFGNQAPKPAPVQPADPVEKPKPSKDRIRGIVKLCVAGEDYRLEMRESGLSARRVKKKHVSHKSLQQILDYVTEQPQLPLSTSPSSEYILHVPARESQVEIDALRQAAENQTELLDYAVEFIACNIAEGNAPGKFTKRLQFAAQAFQAKLEEMTGNAVVERLGKITGT